MARPANTPPSPFAGAPCERRRDLQVCRDESRLMDCCGGVAFPGEGCRQSASGSKAAATSLWAPKASAGPAQHCRCNPSTKLHHASSPTRQMFDSMSSIVTSIADLIVVTQGIPEEFGVGGRASAAREPLLRRLPMLARASAVAASVCARLLPPAAHVIQVTLLFVNRVWVRSCRSFYLDCGGFVEQIQTSGKFAS